MKILGMMDNLKLITLALYRRDINNLSISSYIDFEKYKDREIYILCDEWNNFYKESIIKDVRIFIEQKLYWKGFV